MSRRAKHARRAIIQEGCLEDLRYWVDTNRKTALRIFDLMEAALRGAPAGTLLGGNVWSRRINEADRLVYEVFEDRVEFVQARYHYG